jgi:uncharacterized protein (TIGR04141 family)
MSATRAKKIDLTVYLAKEEFCAADEVLKPNVARSEIPVELNGQQLGSLFLMHSKSNPPPWAGFFNKVVDSEQIGYNRSTGALLTIQDQDRLFLLTFGQGRHLIRPGCIETNFGLRSALNLLRPESIRSIDKSSLEALPKQAREQSGVAVGLQFFGIDVERDLLRAITGTPKHPTLGLRIFGGDPMKISVDIELQEVKPLLQSILRAYVDNSYKAGPFSWIDHIGEVKDRDLADQLDHELVTKINGRALDNIWLCAPQLIEWDRVVGFKYSLGRRALRYHDTRIEEWLEILDQEPIDAQIIRRRKIMCVDSDDYTVFEDTVYRFIYAEIWHEGTAYILNAGKWYAVDRRYVESVEQEYKMIQAKAYERDLLIYDDETETAYNKRLAASNPLEFVLMDTENISLPGAASPIEPCDLYRSGKELIHVKRYGGSSVLSHLFNQGLVSGELLQRDREFREKFNEKLPAALKMPSAKRMPERGEYTVVYAIISEQEEGLTVPFFSKISLKHAVARLEAFGFNVRLAKIPVSEAKKKTKVCPPA